MSFVPCVCVCVCVPVEGDKVTGSSEVSLAVSCRQPRLPCGWFNQTFAELTLGPAGLHMSPATALS